MECHVVAQKSPQVLSPSRSDRWMRIAVLGQRLDLEIVEA